jgi:hypothetical protein
MRAVAKPTRCREIIGAVPTGGPQDTSWRSTVSTSLLLERTFFPDDLPLWIQFCVWLQHHTAGHVFYITFCGQTKHVTRARACSASGTVTSSYPRTWVWSLPRPLYDPWQTECSTIYWFYGNCSTRGCLQICLQLWSGGCGFSTTDLQSTEGNMSGSGWTRRIEEGGLDVEGLLHCVLSHRM